MKVTAAYDVAVTVRASLTGDGDFSIQASGSTPYAKDATASARWDVPEDLQKEVQAALQKVVKAMQDSKTFAPKVLDSVVLARNVGQARGEIE